MSGLLLLVVVVLSPPSQSPPATFIIMLQPFNATTSTNQQQQPVSTVQACVGYLNEIVANSDSVSSTATFSANDQSCMRVFALRVLWLNI